MTVPLVTIGIPAYERDVGLRRALRSLVSQDYPNVEIIVSDDASPTQDLALVVQDFENVRYVRQPVNLGLVNNAFWLRDEAHGKYFMWLADDDEVSADYVSSLVDLLEADPSAVTAMGNWVRLRDQGTKTAYPTSRFEQYSASDRARAFIRKTVDAFFYGVHRTQALRSATFNGFWWPNQDTYPNWCFVFLMDVVLQGRILVAEDQSVQWVNHSYELKLYSTSEATWRRLVRRTNVHWLYLSKIAHALGAGAALRVLPTSLAALLDEWCKILKVAAHNRFPQLREWRARMHLTPR